MNDDIGNHRMKLIDGTGRRQIATPSAQRIYGVEVKGSINKLANEEKNSVGNRYRAAQ